MFPVRKRPPMAEAIITAAKEDVRSKKSIKLHRGEVWDRRSG